MHYFSECREVVHDAEYTVADKYRCRRTENGTLAHMHGNMSYSFGSLEYVSELRMIMVTIHQGGPMGQVKIVKALT